MDFKKKVFIFFAFWLITSSFFSSAWWDETHKDMLSIGISILKNDNKIDAYNLFNTPENLSRLKLGCLAPDNSDDVDNTKFFGWHHYVSRNKNTGELLKTTTIGKYFKNGSGGYLKSARTIFEENYTIALSYYMSYKQSGNLTYLTNSMYYLGKSLHGIMDMCAAPHSLGVFSGLSQDSDHKYFEKYAERNREVWQAQNCPKNLYSDFEQEKMADNLNDLSSVGAEAYKSMKTRISKDLDKDLSKVMPLAEQYIAAVLNKFYYDITINKTPKCLIENNIYRIKNIDSNKYMTIESKKKLNTSYVIQKENNNENNDYQYFVAKLNTDGTFYLQPLIQDDLYVYINWAGNLKLQDYHDQDCNLKIGYSGDNYFYLIDASALNFPKILGINLNKTNIGTHTFDPDSKKHYWAIESCPDKTKEYQSTHQYNSWSQNINYNDIEHHVDSSGTTSVEITENKIIWLKEQSDGTSTWYGLDNTSGVFKEGSRFWVRWITKSSSPEDWQKYYDLLDTSHKNKIHQDKLSVFLVGVTSPDGVEYTDLDSDIKLYVQLKNSDWKSSDIKSVFISADSDEVISTVTTTKSNTLNNVSYPDGTGNFAILQLNHFSPYAVYDSFTSSEKLHVFLIIFSVSLITLLVCIWVFNFALRRKSNY